MVSKLYVITKKSYPKRFQGLALPNTIANVVLDLDGVLVTESYHVKDKLKEAGAKFQKGYGFTKTGWKFSCKDDNDFIQSLTKVSNLGFDSSIFLEKDDYYLIEELENVGASLGYLRMELIDDATQKWEKVEKEEVF